MRPVRPSALRLVAPAVVLLALSAPAVAKTLTPASTTVPASSTTVPLYGGVEATDPFLYVEAQGSGLPVLLRIDASGAAVHLSKAAADRLGLTPSKATTRANATLPSLQIGSVTLSNVEVWVDDSVAPAGTLPVDGSIGLLAFPNVSWAVTPSTGTVTVAPNSGGAALLAAIPLPPVSEPDAGHLATETLRVGGNPVTLGPKLGFPMDVSGVPLRLDWATTRLETNVSGEVDGTSEALTRSKRPLKHATPLPPAPTSWSSAVRVEARMVSGVPTNVHRAGEGADWLVDGADGYAGIDVAQHFDLALDNGAHKAAIALSTGVTKADYGDLLEARLNAAIAAAGPAAPTSGPPSPAEKKRLTALAAYADFLEARARSADALALRKEVAEATPDVCDGWLAYGTTLLAASHPKEAADALAKSQTLYAPWAARTPAERTEIQSDKASAEKHGTWTGIEPQPNACYVATGRLAAAKLILHDYAGISDLYGQLDLDAGLARIAGTAALAQGNRDEAQARFRQAQKLHGVGEDDGARIGLYLAYRASNPTLAAEEVSASKYQFDGHTDPLTLGIWAADVRAHGDAVAPLRALADAHPTDPVLLAALVAEERRTGTTGADDDALAALRAFDLALEDAPRDGRLWADYALFLVAEHKNDEAGKAADLALIFAPNAGETWYAASTAVAAGITVHDGGATIAPEQVAATLKHAGVVGYDNPAYALLGL